MSLHDKMPCARCGHPRHTHTGNHIKGRSTICRKNVGASDKRCACLEFKEKS